jgi:hypothetical protein
MTQQKEYWHRFETRQSIPLKSASMLSITTNTPPQILSATPRWLLRFLPWVNVSSGIYRINQVKHIYDFKQKIIFDENARSLKITPELLRTIDLFATVPMGEIVLKEHDVGDKFYIILDGEFDVSQLGQHEKEVVIGSLSQGDFFGEMGLFENIPRQATICAKTKGRIAWLGKDIFKEIIKDPKLKEKMTDTLEERKKILKIVNQTGEMTNPIRSCHTGEPVIPRGHIDYNGDPDEIHLSVIQTILNLHTRISDIYNVPYDQLEQQIRITVENIREREEWEMIQNPDFGLLSKVAPSMTIRPRSGPPTPDDFDHLLSLVWKKPSFFLAHPLAVAAFGRECTKRGVPPPTIQIFGSPFITWRGIPIVPCDKLPLNSETGTTDIILLRAGEENQGVVGLHKASLGGKSIPSLTIHSMGINDESIASYMITKYFSVAVLVSDAIAVLRNAEVGIYHNYD